MSWIFEKTPLMGGASGEAYGNTLNATGMPLPHLLGREAIQNTVDAGDGANDSPPRIRFSKRSFQGDALAALDRTLGLSDGLLPRQDVLELPEGNTLELLSDPEAVVPVMLVEDWNTVGLGGSLTRNSTAANFRKLLYELGHADKARGDATTGGSYGYGKSVYSGVSSIRTIAVYSAFKGTEETESKTARAMACGYMNPHDLGDESYTGRAWLDEKNEELQAVFPFEEDAAHDFAKALGLEIRSSATRGTSIVIVGCDLDIDVLRDGIEKYWWPRLYENMLEVELFDEDMELAPPRPRGRRELRPFMACFDLVAGRTPEPTDNQKLQRFQSFEGTHLGACAMEALKHEEEEEIDTDTAFVNTVALMRGPRMVVEYQSLGLSHHEPAIGVYIAHSDLELAAKLSEPGTHDRWDPASRRLKSHDAQALDVLLTRLKVSFRNFQRSLTPPPPRSQGRVPELERLLGRFFKVRDDPSPPSPPPPPTEDPINLHFEPIERTVSTESACQAPP